MWKKLEYRISQRSDIMESSDMKNMVVLKNLPSNMVEEAIIIFKENQKVREREFIEKGRKAENIEIQTKSKEFVLKEAEMLVADYINRIENKKKIEKSDKSIIIKYKRLKYYSIISTILFVISLIIKFI